MITSFFGPEFFRIQALFLYKVRLKQIRPRAESINRASIEVGCHAGEHGPFPLLHGDAVRGEIVLFSGYHVCSFVLHQSVSGIWPVTILPTTESSPPNLPMPAPYRCASYLVARFPCSRSIGTFGNVCVQHCSQYKSSSLLPPGDHFVVNLQLKLTRPFHVQMMSG